MILLSKLHSFITEKANILLHIFITIALSISLTILVSEYPGILFPLNLVIVAACAICVYRILFRQRYADSFLKIGCILVIFLAVNDLYSYETLKTYFPRLEKYTPWTLSVIIAAIVLTFIILLKLVQYVERREEQAGNPNERSDSEPLDENASESATDGSGHDNLEHSENGRRPVGGNGGSRTKIPQGSRGHVWSYVVAISTVVLAVAAVITPIYLLYKFNADGADMEALDFDKVLSFLVSYAACGILIVFALLVAVIVVLYIFRYIIRLLRQTVAGLAGEQGAPLSDQASEDGFPTYAFSAIVTAGLMFLTWRLNDFELENLTETLVSANYLALPLTAIVIVVLFFILLQVINTIFLMISTVTSASIKKYLLEIEEKLGVFTGTMDMLELIVHIIMGTATAVLGLVDFVPNFFTWLKDFVLGDKDERERQREREQRKKRWKNRTGQSEKENENQAEISEIGLEEDRESRDLQAATDIIPDAENDVPDMDGGPPDAAERERKKNDDKRGIYIIRVAAFCFAVVSWLATASGLRAYVFTEQKYLQAYLISFGVQAMLFVMNLQLPSYFSRIGKNIGDHVGKRIFVKGFFAIFYTVILVSSSLFSFVYITVSVYKDTKYNDASIVLESAYRTYLSDLEEYVDNAEQISLLNISSVLAELAGMIPDTDEQESSLEKLEAALDEAELEFSKADSALMVAENRYNSAVAVRDVPNTEQWRSNSDHEQERKAAEEALAAYQEALDDYNEKKLALEDAQEAVDDYEEPAGEVINALLAEFISASPDEAKVSSLMEQLESMVLDLADEDSDSGSSMTSNSLFALIVAKSEELTLAVDKYYTFLSVNDAEGSMNDINDLNAALLDGSAIPAVPSSQDDTEREEEISIWTAVWKENFEALKGLMQNVPTYSKETLDGIKDSYGSVETDALSKYKDNASEYVSKIDSLVRNNLSGISDVEWASIAISGEYPFMARFSLCFAVLLDFSSLMAGLFIYYVTKTKDETQAKM